MNSVTTDSSPSLTVLLSILDHIEEPTEHRCGQSKDPVSSSTLLTLSHTGIRKNVVTWGGVDSTPTLKNTPGS